MQDRYDKISTIPFVGQDGLNKLKAAKVLICGAGGVGTNLVINLASMGIGHIGLVDNDKIEERNLAIQILYSPSQIGQNKVDMAKEWALKYNPDINLKTYNLRLDETNYKEIFDEYDIIIDAFDTQKSVWMVNKAAVVENKPIVFTGTMDMECLVQTVIPYKTPCFHCFIEHSNKFQDRPYGVFQSTGAIAAALQTNEVIKLILNKGAITHTSPLIMNCFNMAVFRPKIFFSNKKKCPVCGLPMASFEPFCD